MTTAPARALPEALPEQEWRRVEREHEAGVDERTAAHRARRAASVAHPVEDFLFTYYRWRPSHLRRWHPGVGTALLGEAGERATWRWYTAVRALDAEGRDVEALGVDLAALARERGDLVRSVRRLVAATAGRPAQLGCFGLHEWAMVYRSGDPAGSGGGEVRHVGWPLRLGAAGTDAVVEDGARSGVLRCTHYDAFRFYAGAARPLNATQPTRATQVDLEQPGCLHAGMDLYRHAMALAPATPSDLVLDCFDLAREIRELDMRASPYDLEALGYEAVPVETPAGRAQYVVAQRAFADRGQALRQRLLAVCDAVLEAAPAAAR